MKKIVFAAPYYTENIGDYGQLSVLLDGLRNRLGGRIEAIHLTRHIDSAFDEEYGLRSVLNLDHATKAESVGRWLNGLNPGDSVERLRGVHAALEGADLMVIPGPMLYDISFDFLRGPIPYYAILALLCRSLGVRQMLYGASFVDYRTTHAAEMVKFIVGSCDVATVRESSSAEVLKRVGVDESLIQVLPDPALGLGLVDRGKGSELLRAWGFAPSRRRVCVSLRFFYWLWEAERQVDFEKLIAGLCDRIVREFDSDVVFVPQGTYGRDDPRQDDRYIAALVRERMQEQERAFCVDKRCTVSEALALYRGSEMVVAMRRHALVFAATQHTPIFALYPGEYSPVGEFAKLASDSGSIATTDSFDCNQVWHRLASAWLTRHDQTEAVTAYAESQKEGVARYIQLAEEIMSRGPLD